ncbi:MAG: hypothetical protein U9R29_06735 [Thermodesulfobacteriota bacterium]|nr:hypothetical protein [Thermodesulfobacteriota bacterium]
MTHSMKQTGIKWTALITLTLALLLLASQAFAAPVRIVVLPFYAEEGVDASNGGYAEEHYRRTMRFINNHLDRDGFEVINPFAKENIEREFDRVMERAREDSVLVSRELCEKYGVDAAYIVWMKLKIKTTADGYKKALVILDGEGYDAGGRDLGAGLSEIYKVTRRDRDEAIVQVEKWVGDLVGRKLTTWRSEHNNNVGGVVVTQRTASATGGASLQQNIRKHQDTIEVRLNGATQYEEAEVFGKVVNTVIGVTEATRIGSRMVPNNPQGSYSAWRLQIEGTEPFRLQANIMKMIKDVVAANGDITLKGVPYRYNADEVAMLRGMRTGKTNSRSIQFVIDRNLTMSKERAGGKGFE